MYHKTPLLEVFLISPFVSPPLIMDLKTLLNNLREEVSCSVCMTTFTDPNSCHVYTVFGFTRP